MLLFLNTHLAFSHANEVAVIASHTRSASFLYPSPSSPPSDIASQRDSNKYRKFRVVEDTVQVSLSELMQSTDAADISETNETMISGALSLALTYINRITASDDGTTSIARPGEEKGEVAKMNARILVISVSGDLANQYVSVMNSIFAAQRQVCLHKYVYYKVVRGLTRNRECRLMFAKLLAIPYFSSRRPTVLMGHTCSLKHRLLSYNIYWCAQPDAVIL